MRGLPPLPPDFFSFRLLWQANEQFCTNEFNIFAPGADNADNADMHAFITDWFNFALPELLAVVPANASCNACRLATHGVDPRVVVEQLAPNNGAFGEASMANGTLCLTWRTSKRGSSARSHTSLPLTVELVQGNRQTLLTSYYIEAAFHAQSYIDQINAIHSPDGGLCVAAVVNRSRAGVPLPASEWSPIEQGDASIHIGTLARRISKTQPFPPF